MNNKYILTALCATAFSGINLLADPTLPETNFNEINNQEIREYCTKNLATSPACQKLARTLAAGSEVVGVLFTEIEKEMNDNKINIKNLLSELSSTEKKILEDIKNLSE